MMTDLEKILREKLANHAVHPPADMWARIEESLQNTPAARPRRPLQGVRMAAAAAILAAAVATGVLYLNRDEAVPLAARQPVPEQAAPAAQIRHPQEMPAENLPPATVPPVRKTAPAEQTRKENSIVPQNVTDVFPDEIIPQPRKIAMDDSPAVAAQPETHAHHPTAARNLPAAKIYNPVRKNGRNSLSMTLYAMNSAGGQSDREGRKTMWNGFQLTEIVTRSDITVAQVTLNAPTITSTNHRMPLSFGVNLAMDLSHRLSIETGVAYSYLRSDMQAEGSENFSNYDIRQDLHYIGIPVAVLYKVIGSGSLDLYLKAGGMVEKGVYGQVRTHIEHSKTTNYQGLTLKGVQPSLAAAVGCQFKITGGFGIYIEPGLNYYPQQTAAPESYRTENPLTFNLKAGFRFNILNR